MCDCSRGPVSSMPGSIQKVPTGIKCDKHPEIDATHRIQGETDSFGCEYVDMCVECYWEYLKQKASNSNPGVCDWCNHHSDTRTKTRDYDEGSSGPVYDVCPSCRNKAVQRAQEELAEYPVLDDDCWEE